MTDRPITLKAHEVVAILAGRKTQHRVALKPQPEPDGFWRDTPRPDPCGFTQDHWDRLYTGRFPDGFRCAQSFPYDAGDRLWVREAWRIPGMDDIYSPRQMAAMCAEVGYSRPWCATIYEADGARINWDSDYGDPGRLRQANHLPRWASRLTLLVTDVRVERLQAISEADARAEGGGLYVPGHGFITESELRCDPGYSNYLAPRMGFETIWTETHGPDAWARNDWVCALSFKTIRANIDAPEAQEAA